MTTDSSHNPVDHAAPDATDDAPDRAESTADAMAGAMAGGVSGDVSEDVPGDASDDLSDVVGDAQEALQEARQRLAEVPAEVVVTNHVMGLYELAAIHLSAPIPDLRSASLAIDAVAALVDGLGDRLGEHASTMRDALANIRLAFVQIKSSSQPAPPA